MAGESITVPIIGHVVGGHTGRLDDYKGGVESIIRIHPEHSAEIIQGIDETLHGLEDFSHLQVIWHFSEGTAEDVALHARRPRDNPRWPATGTYAHHNHRRPARLGTSFPRLLRIEGRDLHVADLDADDGTPVVDVVAVFQEMLPRGPVSQPGWPGEMLAHYWDEASERPTGE